MIYTFNAWSQEYCKIFHKNVPNIVPTFKPVYGFAYNINNDTEHKRLSCKPELGEVVDATDNRFPYYYNETFVPYKKDGKTFKQSGHVNAYSRYYADTYEEAVEGYNMLVQKRIDILNEMAKQAEGDKI